MSLRELAADLRTYLEDSRLRGVVAEPVEALSTATPDSVAAAEKPVATAPRQAASWAALAAAARETAEEAVERGGEGLRRLREDLGDCRRCGLCTGRNKIVFGVGSPEADLVIVGEGPGHDEDMKGEPFVGVAGQMLDRMLENVLGLARPQVYICNVVKCRPPGNRNPLPDEVLACRPFLERQIVAIRPKVMLVLGSVALKALFGTDAGIMRRRGSWMEWKDVPVMPTFHPAYLLRNPDDKRKTFEDLKALKARYDELGGLR